MADFLPWFPFDFDDFMEGTIGWTWEERGAYLTLLREQWRRGFIPNEPDRLHFMVIGITPRRLRTMWDLRIKAKFRPVDGDSAKLINDRMAAERAKKEVEVAAKRMAGAAGGAATAAARAEAAAAAHGAAGAAHRSHETADIGPKTDPTRERACGRVEAAPERWGLGAWESLWINTLKCRPADRHKDGRDRWRDLVERIGTDAALLEPPMEPAAYAEALMRALPAYAEHAARKGGEEVPSISVAAFEGWYPKLAAWVAQRRPKATRAAPAAAAPTPPGRPPAAPEAPASPLTPEEEARQAAEARDAMDQFLRRGKYAPQLEPAESEPDDDQPPTL